MTNRAFHISTSMKTSQSFPFYPADFLLGTALMSDAQVGAYMRLLCYQWNDGSLPKDENLLAQLARTEKINIEAILSKFREGSDGRLRNQKLEKVRKSLNAYRKTRSDNGRKGGRPKKHMVSGCFRGAFDMKSLPSPIPSPSPTPLTPQEREKLLTAIQQAYPRPDSPAQCRESIEAAIDSGEDPHLILQLVRKCATFINLAPGGSRNRFVPSAAAFFQRQQWREPEVFAERWRVDEPKDDGPKEMTLK